MVSALRASAMREREVVRSQASYIPRWKLQSGQGGEPPQRDQQLPGERDDEYRAHAPVDLPDPTPEPRGEAAAGLVAEPEPGEIDHRRPQSAVAGFRDALLPVDAAAGEEVPTRPA